MKTVKWVIIVIAWGHRHAVGVSQEHILKASRQHAVIVLPESIKIAIPLKDFLRDVKTVIRVLIVTRGHRHVVRAPQENILQVVREHAQRVVLEGHLQTLLLAGVEIVVVGNTRQ